MSRNRRVLPIPAVPEWPRTACYHPLRRHDNGVPFHDQGAAMKGKAQTAWRHIAGTGIKSSVRSRPGSARRYGLSVAAGNGYSRSSSKRFPRHETRPAIIPAATPPAWYRSGFSMRRRLDPGGSRFPFELGDFRLFGINALALDGGGLHVLVRLEVGFTFFHFLKDGPLML